MRPHETRRIIEEVGLVPVIRARSAEQALRAARAVHAGGVRIIEVTMTVPDALLVMRELASSLPKDVLIGAGTVLDATTARACIAAGAEFVVGPGLDLELIKTAHEHGKAVIAGALTPTEVIQAWRAGADLVKVFPCSALGGARYLRALRGPLPNVRLVPTGGVNLHTAEAYIVAGASALGVGSELVDSEALEGGQDARLIERAREFVRTIGDARRIIGSYRKGRSQ